MLVDINLFRNNINNINLFYKNVSNEDRVFSFGYKGITSADISLHVVTKCITLVAIVYVSF